MTALMKSKNWPRIARMFTIICGLTILCGWQTSVAQAQASKLPNNTYHLFNAATPTGMIAHAQAAGRKPGVGTYTAVSIIGSKGLKVGLARDGQFLPPIDAPVTTGMLVGGVYRFRVTGISDRSGFELYPTLEIIDKTYPEPGREHRFPIPVFLTDEDLQMALDGALVTRVIYLEDSENADPVSTKPGTQLTIDVGANENALRTADVLGRPLAILRIGSRVPADLTGDLTDFLYGCPPWVPLPVVPDRDKMIKEGLWPEVVPVERAEKIFSENTNENIPRLPPTR
jgi:hypothetical protein